LVPKVLLLSALLLALASPSRAQLAPPEEAGIAMGHIHLNVTDVEAQRRFWIGQFEAKPLDRPGLAGVKLPGMLILFNAKAPAHGSEGTVLDHFGFKVRSRDEMVARCRAAGYAIPKEFQGSEGYPNAYVTGPDGLKVEMQEETSLPVRAVAQHLHYLLPDYLTLRAWYVGVFSMKATTRGPHDSADIPGMNLTFAPAKAQVDRPTVGGIIDHIGFEVRNLAAFCRKLEAGGVKLDVPYQRDAGQGFASAFLTDPNGVLIELTEGLSNY
jgi:catechol 2,3-dioxygenase-like lactoylglutathione lyase family enzyme